MLTDYNPNAS
ncbi:hypothetical protein JL09_g4946 [Pichia kudriavzevii]|uniref:Uncharacterized protein n=1 Tax=Pichia kudriavzevii TaxID=4909 RepID=A0A099NVE3_PICKU|nr:hypothetical protein JL09_g4946 [Pichia kudriavzevii]